MIPQITDSQSQEVKIQFQYLLASLTTRNQRKNTHCPCDSGMGDIGIILLEDFGSTELLDRVEGGETSL